MTQWIIRWLVMAAVVTGTHNRRRVATRIFGISRTAAKGAVPFSPTRKSGQSLRNVLQVDEKTNRKQVNKPGMNPHESAKHDGQPGQTASQCQRLALRRQTPATPAAKP